MRLKDPAMRFFPIADIHPSGYLLEQLKIQARGLSGNLHTFWRDIKDSKWIGGDADGWERVPYWLDGFIPLAYLLEDEEMKRTAKFYIDHILAQQAQDGWICPCEERDRAKYDVWAYFLVLKVLTVYADASGDGRIEEAVYRALKRLDAHIDVFTLFDWAQTRWYECLISIYWLLERREEPWLYDLVDKIKGQGFDFYQFFRHWPYTQKTPRGKWSQMSHVVNNAMMLKGDALYGRCDKRAFWSKRAERMYRKLMKHHGTVVGTFTGDECLAGKDPTQGTELCAVAELMYSFEQLISLTGDAVWGDRLDMVTFNALFATFSPDMWTHQYDQQVNQVFCCEMKEPVYTTNPGDSNLFGLEPNFGCCTSNLSQALPKYVLSSFLYDGESVIVNGLSPCELHTHFQGSPLTVRVKGAYPFDDDIAVEVAAEQPVQVKVRIPAWANAEAQIDGAPVPCRNGYCVFSLGPGTTRIDIFLRPQTEIDHRGGGRIAFRRGALVYALAIEEEWRQVHTNIPGREFPHCDYEVLPKGEWQFAICSEEAVFERKEFDGCPFDPRHVPNRLYVKCVEYPWAQKDGCVIPRRGTKAGRERTMIFLPYGATSLRLTELPFYDLKKRTGEASLSE